MGAQQAMRAHCSGLPTLICIGPHACDPYREMLQSEPSLAQRFLEAARRREASLGVDVQDGGWGAEEDEQRVRWAYAEARKLLQRYSGVREALQERMATGVSAGECVCLIEERLKNSWSVV